MDSEEPKRFSKIQNIYEKDYKKLIIIPIIILIISISILGLWKINTDEFISKDVSLKGGLLITVKTDQPIDITNAESQLGSSFTVKALSSIGTGGLIGYTFETESGQDREEVISKIADITGLDYSDDTYSIEEISPLLGESFFQSTIKAIALAFVFMAIVVFIYFRKIIPSLAIVMAAGANIISTLAVMNVSGILLSSAGVAALLMLIGYSVDSNILLSIKVLKRKEGNVLDRIFIAMRTGLTMEFTTLAALSTVYIIAPASSLKTIALVLIIGLLFDLVFTWIFNSSILRMYMEKNGR